MPSQRAERALKGTADVVQLLVGEDADQQTGGERDDDQRLDGVAELPMPGVDGLRATFCLIRRDGFDKGPHGVHAGVGAKVESRVARVAARLDGGDDRFGGRAHPLQVLQAKIVKGRGVCPLTLKAGVKPPNARAERLGSVLIRLQENFVASDLVGAQAGLFVDHVGRDPDGCLDVCVGELNAGHRPLRALDLPGERGADQSEREDGQQQSAMKCAFELIEIQRRIPSQSSKRLSSLDNRAGAPSPLVI